MSSTSKRRRKSYFKEDETDVDGGGDLSNEHQLLLQYLIHARMVKKLDLARVHGKLFSNDESLNDSIAIITNVIDSLKMDIKQTKCDITGETYFIVIHTSGDLFFPKSCMFSKNQLEFLKKILTSIVTSDGKISKIEALNMSQQPMSKSDADECLGLFVKEKLLLELNDGKQFCLSPLSAVEFAPFFTACLADDLTSCDLCKQLVFVGKVCNGTDCGMKFHYHCFSKYAERGAVCPTCSTPWSNGDEMDEDTE